MRIPETEDYPQPGSPELIAINNKFAVKVMEMHKKYQCDGQVDPNLAFFHAESIML